MNPIDIIMARVYILVIVCGIFTSNIDSTNIIWILLLHGPLYINRVILENIRRRKSWKILEEQNHYQLGLWGIKIICYLSGFR